MISSISTFYPSNNRSDVGRTEALESPRLAVVLEALYDDILRGILILIKRNAAVSFGRRHNPAPLPHNSQSVHFTRPTK